MVLKTRLTEMLGIQHPIVQGKLLEMRALGRVLLPARTRQSVPDDCLS